MYNFSSKMKLDDSVIRRFSTAKCFKDFQFQINSLDFTSDGLCLISSDDECIGIYDCTTGTRKRQLFSKKYGASLIKFAHQPDTAIHASTKIDDTIRYLNLPDNRYIHYFGGHTKKVTQLAVPTTEENWFVSGSLDRTVRVWDFRSQNCQ
uniref:Uncharacterized protein n=1 Tax=Romanomermis culicivorax TaxID=13658 RepID=A0A915HN91_ROMCU